MSGFESRCSSCGAAIRFVRTPTGAAMPLDVDPADDGNVLLGWIGGAELALVLTDPAERAAAQLAGKAYRPHFDSCAHSARHRVASGQLELDDVGGPST